MKVGRASLLQGAMEIFLLAGFLVSCASGERRVYSELRPIARSLGGYDSNANRDAMNALFAGGRAAIPILVEVLDSEAVLSLECGSYSLHSETVEVDFDSPVSEGHARFVGEIVLYLIESIMKSDIYFAQDCSLEIDGRVVSDSAAIHERIQSLASVLERRSPSELEKLTLQDLEAIMGENGLGFPQGKF